MASHFAAHDSQYERLSRSNYTPHTAHRGHRGNNNGRRHHSHVGLVIGLVIVAIVAVCGACGFRLYRSAMTAKGHAEDMVTELSTLKEAVKSGDTDALNNSVNTIVEDSDALNVEVTSPLWKLAANLPVVGEDVRSVQTLGAASSALVNDALVPIAQSVSGKKLSDIMHDGSFDVETISSVVAAVDQATPTIEGTLDTIDSLPEAHIPQLASAIEKVKTQTTQVRDALAKAKPILDVLPQMLGANGQTRTYLVIAQNNSELRSTGGLPGSWGTVTINNGTLTMGDFTTILHESGLKVDITDEERNAMATNMDTDPAQVNCDPDFVRVGELARDYWAQTGGGDIDGVIAIDPVFLQRLVALTGSITAPDGATLDGTNTAQALLSDVYWKYGDNGDAQDAYFASVAELAFKSVLSNLGNASIKDLKDVYKKSAADGRLLVWMYDQGEEQVMQELGVAGGLSTDPATPVLGVYLNDDSYSKLSWYTQAGTTIDGGTKNADGTTTYNVTTTLTNTITPEEAASAPIYIYGGNADKRNNSDMLHFVYFIAPAGGTITNFSASDGLIFTDYGINEATLSGLQFIRVRTHLRSGESGTFTYQVTVPAEATQPLALRTTPLAQESLMSNSVPASATE